MYNFIGQGIKRNSKKDSKKDLNEININNFIGERDERDERDEKDENDEKDESNINYFIGEKDSEDENEGEEGEDNENDEDSEDNENDLFDEFIDKKKNIIGSSNLQEISDEYKIIESGYLSLGYKGGSDFGESIRKICVNEIRESRESKIKNVKVIGNNVKNYIENLVLDWSILMKDLNDKKDDDVCKDLVTFAKQLPYLFLNGNKTNLKTLLLKDIKDVYNLTPKQHIKIIIKNSKSDDALILSIKNIFMETKIMFEQMIEVYWLVKQFIQGNKNLEDNTKEYKKMVENWTKLNDENINTSSIILYFGLNEVTLSEGIIAEVIDNKPIDFNLPLDLELDDIEKVNDLITDFVNDIKGFKYKGFCPCDPYNRYKELISFPYEKLLNLIKVLLGYSDCTEGIKIIEDINEKLNEKMVINKFVIPDDIKKIDEITELNEHTTKHKDFDEAAVYINCIINYHAYLTKKVVKNIENYYCDEIEKINTVITKIQNIQEMLNNVVEILYDEDE